MRLCARVVVFVVLVLLSVSSTQAQESAEFLMRGEVLDVFPIHGDFNRALVRVDGVDTYWVTCHANDCGDDLEAAEGQCADFYWGTIFGDFTSGSSSHEYLSGYIVESPANCVTQRDLFLFIGHVTGYVLAPLTQSGKTEFDMSAGDSIFRVVCNSLGCSTSVQTAYYFGRCVAVNGSMETTTLGDPEFGDTWVRNDESGVQVFNRTDC